MTTGKTIALTRQTFVGKVMSLLFFFFFLFIYFFSWKLITSQHCSGFGHTLTWISDEVTCIPHPDPPSHLPLHPIPLDLPSAPGPSTCLMHPTWAGDLFHLSLLFNMLSRLVITFLPRYKCLLISWLVSPSAVILEPPKIKSLTVFTVSPSICYEVMGPDTMILVFWMSSFKPTFSLSSFPFIKRLFSSLLSAIRVVSSMYLRLLVFLPAILIPVCASSSLAFHMRYFACKLNKQSDNIQSWHTPLCCSMSNSVASWPAYRFLRRQIRWSGILISWRIFQSLLWSAQSKALA